MTTFVPNPTGQNPNGATALQGGPVLQTPAQGYPFLMGGGAPGSPLPTPPLQFDPGPNSPPTGSPPPTWRPGMNPFLKNSMQPHHAAIKAGMGLNPKAGRTTASGPFSGPGYYHINGLPMLLPGNNLATGGQNNWLGGGANLQPATGATGPVSDQQIQQWLSQNPGASDGQIAQAMGQYGITPDRLATATGADPASVMQRYAAVGQNILNNPSTT